MRNYSVKNTNEGGNYANSFVNVYFDIADFAK
jgi:hypothetical protein